MTSELQKVESNTSVIPFKWQERFILKRYDLTDIEITLEARDALLNAMSKGGKFFQVGKTTVIIGSIKAIEPKYGEKNIPPKPAPHYEYKQIDNGSMREVLLNKEEMDEWDRLFGDKV